MLERLSLWRERSAFRPLDEFVWSLMKESGYYTFAGALPGGAQRQANLRALVDKALDFQNSHMKGLAGFISYAEHIRRRADVGQARLIGESEDVLRILTVHKSKGLEFPVVIVAGLGAGFVKTPAGGAVGLHKDVGFALRGVDPDAGLYRTTLLQSLIGRKKAEEERAEETRILYVAFTRAMDRLILLGTAKGGLAGLRKRAVSAGGSSHLEAIAPFAESAGFKIHEITVSELAAARARADAAEAPGAWEPAGTCDPETLIEVEKRLGFVYPHEKAASVKSKYSVTEIAAREAALADGPPSEAPFAASAPRFMTARRFSAAEKGGLAHRALERVDFRAAREALAREGGLEALLGDMVSSGVFTREEAGAVDMRSVRNFLESDICRRAVASPELHKETPFVIRKEYEGEEALVQGVIDCWFVEDGGIVLLDYKSGAAGSRGEAPRRAAARYRPQLEIYAEALSATRGTRVAEMCLFLLGEGLCLKL
jgi:ATP-dependent helicase/nuclease subunit A